MQSYCIAGADEQVHEPKAGETNQSINQSINQMQSIIWSINSLINETDKQLINHDNDQLRSLFIQENVDIKFISTSESQYTYHW